MAWIRVDRGVSNHRKGRVLSVAMTALALGGTLAGEAAAETAPVTETFLCAGFAQGFSVPAGVTSLQVSAIGAQGGTLPQGSRTGGRGAQVTATLVVTPGEFLRINVGCPANGRVGGFNGGGTANTAQFGGEGAGGGGASDVRSEAGGLSDRLLVAAGGGGEGGTNEFGNSTTGGGGGHADQDGGNADGTTNSRGRAGTATSGGAGGSPTGTSQQGDPQPGTPGQAGIGGNGGAYGVNTPGRGGGGGGGGLFGGGGGGGGGLGSSTSFGGGGGGGGSSLVPDGGALELAPAGTSPAVTITYVPPPPECSDGLDNDGDGLIDFPDDPGCSDENDNSEVDSPVNDDFEDAAPLTGSSASATGSNVEATVQPGEPDHAGAIGGGLVGHSIWYRWTAPGSGSTTIELCGSDYDSVLAVYTGTAVDALTEVTSNDDSGDEACGSLNSRVTFDATQEVTYHIAVDGFNGDSGNVSLSLTGPSGPADTVPPTVTLEQAPGQADPTTESPITFTATFSERVSGFEASDVDLSASTAGGTLAATVSDAGDQRTYTIEVTGMTGTGDVVASIGAAAAIDDAGNPSEASTSDDNVVTYEVPVETGPATLSVELEGPGGVLSDPGGILCGTDCTEDYDPGTSVALHAYARRGTSFTGWGGACAGFGATPTCTLTIDADTEVSATFERAASPPPSQVVLSAEVAGGEHGGVVSDPGGIRCGNDCSEGYPAGTEVTLSAVPRRGASFAGWGGACSTAGTDPTCTLVVTADTQVSATFQT